MFSSRQIHEVHCHICAIQQLQALYYILHQSVLATASHFLQREGPCDLLFERLDPPLTAMPATPTLKASRFSFLLTIEHPFVAPLEVLVCEEGGQSCSMVSRPLRIYEKQSNLIRTFNNISKVWAGGAGNAFQLLACLNKWSQLTWLCAIDTNLVRGESIGFCMECMLGAKPLSLRLATVGDDEGPHALASDASAPNELDATAAAGRNDHEICQAEGLPWSVKQSD